MSALVRDFEVSRANLRETRVRESTPAPLVEGQLRVAIERFALTANNITYAVFGEAMAYWKFFPAEAGWGRIPVWGYGVVTESKHAGVAKGERIYGYLPMSTEVLLQPGEVSASGFTDATPARKGLPLPYQQYRRLAGDPGHDPRREDARPLLQPLFSTSYLIEDFFADNAMFGARQVILASASSKTALSAAFQFSRNRPNDCQVVGLTSPRNRAFCESLGVYDRVLTYKALAELDAQTPSAYVDMAGDGELLHAVHHHFGDALKYSCIVGATHWENRATQHALPGAKPAFFFAPTQLGKRYQEWGPAGFMQRFNQAWQPFLSSVDAWLKIERRSGVEAVRATYLEVLEGQSTPEKGYILAV